MTEEVNQAFNIWVDAIKPFVIPAIGAIAGIFLKDLFDGRNRKKDFGISDAEFLCQQVEAVREHALEYWSGNASSDVSLLEARITGMLHGCAEIIASINLGNNDDKDELMNALTDLRKVCTSGSFGQGKQGLSKQRLNEIEIEGRTMVAKILSFRRK